MVTSLFRVGQSVLMRAKEGEIAARHRTTRIILSLRLSQVEFQVSGLGIAFILEKHQITKY